MSERTFRINIKSIADTGALEQTERASRSLKSTIQGLDKEFDGLNESMASGHTAQAASRMGALGGQSQAAAGAVSNAGKSSGNAGMAVLELSRALEDAQYGIRGVLNNLPGLIGMLGGGAGLAGVISIAAVAITQLWEKFSTSAKAEADLKSLTAAAEEMEARLESLSKVPSLGIEEALERVVERAKNALAEVQKLAKLNEIDTKAGEAELNDAREEEVAAIDADPNLTPEQKEQEKAKIKQQQLFQEAEGRDAERRAKEAKAMEEVDIAEREIGDSTGTLAEAKQRAARAAQIELEAKKYAQGKRRYFDSDEEVKKYEEDYLKSERGLEGVGTAEEEMKAAADAQSGFDKSLEARVAARKNLGTLRETNTAESAADWQKTNRAIRDAEPKVDAGKLNGAADAATSAAEDVGKSAEKLATSSAESSSRIAGDLRQLTQVVSSSMSSIQAAVADNSRAIAAVAQRTDAASQMAAAALAAVNDNRAGARINNRR